MNATRMSFFVFSEFLNKNGKTREFLKKNLKTLAKRERITLALYVHIDWFLPLSHCALLCHKLPYTLRLCDTC